MNSFIKLILFFIAVLGFGCGGNKNSSVNDGSSLPSDLGRSWEKFIATAKDRAKNAPSNFKTLYTNGNLTLDITSDDVKFDPIKKKAIGKVELVTYSQGYTAENDILLGKGSMKIYSDWALRFQFESGSWQFYDGSRRSMDFDSPNKSNPTVASVESLNEDDLYQNKNTSKLARDFQGKIFKEIFQQK